MKTNWQYVTFDYSLQLNLEPNYGEATPVKVEVEYDPLDLEPNETTVYIPCRHSPECMDRSHTLVVDGLINDKMWLTIDMPACAHIREHHAARMMEEE